MKKFLTLLRKEIKELVTLQMLAPLIIVVIVFYFIGNVVGKEQSKIQASLSVAVLDQDNSAESRKFSDILKERNFKISSYQNESRDGAIEKAKSENLKALIVIPSGFGKNLPVSPQNVEVYTIMQSLSPSANRAYGPIVAALNSVNEYFSNELISGKIQNVNIQNLKNPIRMNDVVIVEDKQAVVSPAALGGFIASQTTFIPIILFMVIVFASQMIAISMATEKENKTLETILSAPVSRNAILYSKLLGAGLVALLTSVIYLFGMRSYMNGVTGGGAGVDASVKTAAEQLGLVLKSPDYILLGVSLFLGILVALAVALILGSFAEDVKSAQGIMAPLTMIILIPYLLSMFVDITSVSPAMRWGLNAIPFAHPFFAAPNLLLKNYQPVLFGILYMLIVFVVFVFIASRIFARDKILTMRINLKRERVKQS